MASRFNTLVFGELDDLYALVDAGTLQESELRAVLLNLIRRVQKLEEKAERTPALYRGE